MDYNYTEPHDFESTEAFIVRCTGFKGILGAFAKIQRVAFLKQLEQIRDLPEVIR